MNDVIAAENLSDEIKAEAIAGLQVIEKYGNRIIENWVFADDADGWEAQNMCTVSVVNGALVITSEGEDPYVGTTVDIPEQKMIVELRIKHDQPRLMQIFFLTDQKPGGDPDSTINFEPKQSNGDWVIYQHEFTPKGRMTGFRFDPAIVPGVVEVDYIRLLKPE